MKTLLIICLFIFFLFITLAGLDIRSYGRGVAYKGKKWYFYARPVTSICCHHELILIPTIIFAWHSENRRYMWGVKIRFMNVEAGVSRVYASDKDDLF